VGEVGSDILLMLLFIRKKGEGGNSGGAGFVDRGFLMKRQKRKMTPGENEKSGKNNRSFAGEYQPWYGGRKKVSVEIWLPEFLIEERKTGTLYFLMVRRKEKSGTRRKGRTIEVLIKRFVSGTARKHGGGEKKEKSSSRQTGAGGKCVKCSGANAREERIAGEERRKKLGEKHFLGTGGEVVF